MLRVVDQLYTNKRFLSPTKQHIPLHLLIKNHIHTALQRSPIFYHLFPHCPGDIETLMYYQQTIDNADAIHLNKQSKHTKNMIRLDFHQGVIVTN